MIANRKKISIIIFLIIFTSIALYASVLLQREPQVNANNTLSAEPPTSNNRIPNHNHQITGLHFTSFQEDKKVLSLKANEFYTQHKKIGVFRFGLMREALFKKVTIDIYNENRGTACETDGYFTNNGQTQPDLSGKNAVTSSHIFGHKDSKPNVELALFHNLTQEVTSQFKMGHISTIKLEPVCFRIHNGDTIVSMIRADSAIIDIMGRKVIFHGDIKVESGEKKLMADKITIRPKSGLLEPAGNAVLVMNGQRYSCEGLDLDYCLNKVSLPENDNIWTAASVSIKEEP